MNDRNNPKPVLKWAGGKRQLAEKIRQHFPNQEWSTYYEPFLGGAAILFDNLPNKAVASDLNGELVNMYLTIRDNPLELIEELMVHERNHSSDHYYTVRAWDREENYSRKTKVEKAARTIYLNRTCYNGLYRVNKQGYFNTPIGRYNNPKIVDVENIMAISKYFNTCDITILNQGYKDTVASAVAGDFVYLDPPYDTDEAAFTGYTELGFSRADQEELKEICDSLDDKGVLFLQSNSNTNFIRELYEGYYISIVPAKRNINRNGNNRTAIEEVLISNYKIGEQ